jgi:DNA repair protein RadC
LNYTTALVNLPLVREASGERITTPEEAMKVCSDLAYLAQESFHILTLNTKKRLINRHMISLGGVNSTPVSIAECFRCAVQDSASTLIAAHGHPSGDVSPSAEDIRITRGLVDAGKIIGIAVIDHVIIGRDLKTGEPRHLSLREQGLCRFEQ